MLIFQSTDDCKFYGFCRGVGDVPVFLDMTLYQWVIGL